MSRRLRLTLTVVAIVTAGVALALPVQRLGCPQRSHDALLRALLDGTPRVDAWAHDICDVTERGDHTYSNKAPGLAFVALPAYAALRAVGAFTDERDDVTTAVWWTTIWVSVLPMLLLLVLVHRVAERLHPGAGWPAALTLGAGSMALPYATLLVSQSLSALLVFAAFAILVAERRRPGTATPLLVGAGILAGYAVAVDYPLAILSTVLAGYAVSRRPRVRRLAAYAAGGVIGIAPLLAYQWWAFGSPFTISYSSSGTEDVGASHAGGRGFFGLFVPALTTLARLLFSERGLLTLTPVLATAAIGVVVLARRGARAEAAVITAATAATLLYVSSLTLTPEFIYGGAGPQSRYAFGMLPFLAVAVGVAFRRAFAVVAPLLAVSILMMTVVTITDLQVEVGETYVWWRRLRAGDVFETAVGLYGGPTGWTGAAPFLLALATAVGVAVVLSRPPPVDLSGLAVALTALAAWAAVYYQGPSLMRLTGLPATIAMFALAGTLTAVVAAAALAPQPTASSRRHAVTGGP